MKVLAQANLPLAKCVVLAFWLGVVYISAATEYYVDGVNGSNSKAGTSWSLARKTISSAYSIAGNGDTIIVADGTYPRVSLSGNKSVVIKSVGGADKAFIDANYENRCAYLGEAAGETNVVLEGFSLIHGLRDGSGGGSYYGTLRDCKVIGNVALRSGGAAWGSRLENCLIISNRADNCGGAAYGSVVVSCQVYANVATNWGGAFYECDVCNSVIAGNRCERYGGAAYDSKLVGCTVFGNSADIGAGGVYEGSATNTILWANKTGTAVNNWLRGTFGYCVLKPLADGVGNTDSNPLLRSESDFDGRICSGSPCYNTGCNAFVTTTEDVAGNVRIQAGTVDIGAYEGVVDEEGGSVDDAEKLLCVEPGVKSEFSFNDGSTAFIFGVSPVSVGDFSATTSDGVLRFENSNIIDAEKSDLNSDDDLWCQVLTEVNLCVWSGWSQYIGMSDEDDIADYLRENATFTESTNVLKWVLSRAAAKYDTYVSWSWATNDAGTAKLVSSMIDRTQNADKWIYLQLDWVNDGTTDKIGSHAVTCCGYQLKEGTVGNAPSDLIGLFIIDSDNDKKNGVGGRYAFNSITRIPVEWDSTLGRFFLKFPNKTGMLRFLCYLERRPFNYVEATTIAGGVPIPYQWLLNCGLYNPVSGMSADQIAVNGTGKYVHGREMKVWEEYVAGTNPSDADDKFTVSIGITNGVPTLSWLPDLGSDRVYKIYGTDDLTSGAWQCPTNDRSRFFKVVVELESSPTVCGHGYISSEAIAATNTYLVDACSLKPKE